MSIVHEDPSLYKSLQRETDITWELIAEMSKNQNGYVFEMLLKYYNDKCISTGTSPDDKKQEDAPKLSKYLSYPENELHTLFEMFKIEDIFKYYKINIDLNNNNNNKKKKKKGNNKKGKNNTRDEIRNEQIRSYAEKMKPFFKKQERTHLQTTFSTNITEVILLYYLHISHHCFLKHRTHIFIDAILSLRDALNYFEQSLNDKFKTAIHEFISKIEKKFPWKSLFKQCTQLLIKNHFKTYFQRALRPFSEQCSLLQEIAKNPEQCYILPWGVGTGKTSMLPALASIYKKNKGYQTIYCVPFGPVRDQSAALLYRCGIPFAYVVECKNSLSETQFELQPSYHCGDNTEPLVLIVSPEFVQTYINYWNEYSLLVDNLDDVNPCENPPPVSLPNHKRRYKHLNHKLWKSKYILILDEPSEENTSVYWILCNLPKISFIMSATSWTLVDDTVKQMYTDRFENIPQIIPAKTIGVSTTLIGYWLENNPVLSPFMGIKTKEAFKHKLKYIRTKILWKRFLSAEVLIHWLRRFLEYDWTNVDKESLLSNFKLSFDLKELTFDSICHRLLEWCDIWVEKDEFDDSFFEYMFCFPKSKPVQTIKNNLDTILTKESYLFSGGCIIGTPNVHKHFKMIESHLDNFPTCRSLNEKIRRYRSEITNMYKTLSKMQIQSQEDLYRKQQRIKEIEQQRIIQLPIDEELIINTPKYIEKHTSHLTNNISMNIYSRVQDIIDIGEPLEDVDGWQVYPDEMKGSFAVENEELLRWRWKGVGSIIDHKEFNMKNIKDSDNGYLSFLTVDSMGSHGLNLNITHGILMKDEDNNMLSPTTCLQMAGRVGRWGQDGTGFVYITDKDIFDLVFSV